MVIDNSFTVRERGESIIEKRILRSSKVRVSKSGDLAYVWLIQDIIIDGDLVHSYLILIGLNKSGEEWLIDAVSAHEVEKGWTW